MVNFTEDEKKQLCITMALHLQKIRQLLDLTQAELGAICGFSRTRISQIERGASKMTWPQLTSILFLCMCNIRSKEYIYANKLLSPRFLLFVQHKDENSTPDVNILVRHHVMASYEDMLRSYKDDLIKE